MREQQDSDGASLWEEQVCLDCLMTNIQPEVGLQRLVDLSTISDSSTGTGTAPLNSGQFRHLSHSLDSTVDASYPSF